MHASKSYLHTKLFGLFFLVSINLLIGQEKATPIFKDGEAQVVAAFNTPSKWIRTDLWVETTFDSDDDAILDCMYGDVTRPY